MSSGIFFPSLITLNEKNCLLTSSLSVLALILSGSSPLLGIARLLNPGSRHQQAFACMILCTMCMSASLRLHSLLLEPHLLCSLTQADTIFTAPFFAHFPSTPYSLLSMSPCMCWELQMQPGILLVQSQKHMVFPVMEGSTYLSKKKKN